MDINNIDKAKALIDNYFRLKEIEKRLEDGESISVTKRQIVIDEDDDETSGLDYIDKVRIHIPSPFRAAFIQDVKKMMEIEACKIAEL